MIAGFLISVSCAASFDRKHTAGGVKPSGDARSRPVRVGVENRTNWAGAPSWCEARGGDSEASRSPHDGRRVTKGGRRCAWATGSDAWRPVAVPIPSTRHARRTRAYISTRYIPPPSSQSNPDRRLYAVPFWSAAAGSTGRFNGGLLRRRSQVSSATRYVPP